MSDSEIPIDIIPKKTPANRGIIKTQAMETDSPTMEFPRDTERDQDHASKDKPGQTTFSKRRSEDQFMDVLSAFALSRVIFVVLAQAAWMDIRTVGNYCAVFIPLQISVYHLNFAYEQFKWRAFRIAFGILKVFLLFGIAWTVPSTFATSNDTLSNLTAILCLSRTYFAVVSIIDANNFQTIFNPSFINACLVFPPLIAWILCFFTSTSPQFYSTFVIGTLVDIGSTVFGDLFKSQRLELSSKVYRPIFSLIGTTESLTSAFQCYIGCCLWYFFEARKFVEYPDTIAAVQFNLLNYFYGCMAALILYYLNCMYNYSMKFWMLDSDRHCQNRPIVIFFYTTFLRWLHFILTGSVGLLTACLSLLVFDLYTSPTLLTNQFPVVLSTFPDNIQFNQNSNIDYFKKAAAAGGITIGNRSTFYLPVLVGIFGFLLIFQSFTEIAACRLSHVDVRFKSLSTLIPGTVFLFLAFLPESSWQATSAKIIVLSTTFGISTFLLGLSQFFVMAV